MTAVEQKSSSILVDALVGIAIAALFSGLNYNLGAVKIQLSDILAALCVFLIMLRGFTTPRMSKFLLTVLAAYLLLFSVSALAVGVVSGMKEIVQSVLAFSFLFVCFGYYRTHSIKRLLAIASALTLLILLYNIGWHIAQGKYVSWKQLNEPKTVFTVLPLLLILLFTHFEGQKRRAVFFIGFVAAAVIILLSGERKAYIFAVAAMLVWTAPINWRHGIAAVLILPVLWMAALQDQSGYLDRQIASFKEAFSENGRAKASLANLLDANRPTTMSNAQREISQRLAHSMWQKKPLLGIGTNAFKEAIKQDTSLPVGFRLGIHGEFYRALYENGIVGLALYCTLWLGALVRIVSMWPSTKAVGDSDLNKIKLLCIAMFLIYCAFEASKGLTLLCICALPFIVALAPRLAARPVRSKPLAVAPHVPIHAS